MAEITQKIIPFLWFEKGAEDAANYYVSVFSTCPGRDLASGGPNSKILSVVNYPEAAEEVSGQKAGSVMTVELELDGVKFQFLNGGKVEGFSFSSATSFVVSCKTQEEIDHFWSKLSAVPEVEQCGCAKTNLV